MTSTTMRIHTTDGRPILFELLDVMAAEHTGERREFSILMSPLEKMHLVKSSHGGQLLSFHIPADFNFNTQLDYPHTGFMHIINPSLLEVHAVDDEEGKGVLKSSEWIINTAAEDIVNPEELGILLEGLVRYNC